MSLLGDFLREVLAREEVQEAAAALVVDFLRPKAEELPPEDVLELEEDDQGIHRPRTGEEPAENRAATGKRPAEDRKRAPEGS